MGRPYSWKKVTRDGRFSKVKRFYKRHVNRKNRRAAHMNPLSIDKKLNSWDID